MAVTFHHACASCTSASREARSQSGSHGIIYVTNLQPKCRGDTLEENMPMSMTKRNPATIGEILDRGAHEADRLTQVPLANDMAVQRKRVNER
jgi:hypothetical protein